MALEMLFCIRGEAAIVHGLVEFVNALGRTPGDCRELAGFGPSQPALCGGD
ncbi:MAG: hypothetical protein QNJ43_22585 [Breoghania sp.]|nr:hypothetical protein [Breoghania sp.]